MAGSYTDGKRSMRRSFIGLSLLLTGSLACPVPAAEIDLQPYTASYDLYRGGLHLAVTELNLERREHDWRWVSVTRARGIYKLFTDKRPYAETRFSRIGERLLVTEILLGQHGGNRHQESARFDWSAGRLEVTRKSKRSEAELDGPVYDYQSIHLLAAAMGQSQLEQQTIDFYRKGKLVKSSLVYSGIQAVEIDGKSIDANVYEQVVERSKSTIRYFYDPRNPLLPLRIERLEDDEKPSILRLREVAWGL